MFLSDNGISESMLSSEVLEKITDNYSIFREYPIEDFVNFLCSDLILRINETEKDITFLSKNSNLNDADDLLKSLQFWESGISGEEHDFKKIRDLERDFKANVKFGTLNKWKIRSKKLLKEKNQAKSLEIWKEIDSQLSPIELMISEAVDLFYQEVDLRIDEAKLNYK